MGRIDLGDYNLVVEGGVAKLVDNEANEVDLTAAGSSTFPLAPQEIPDGSTEEVPEGYTLFVPDNFEVNGTLEVNGTVQVIE